MIANGGIDYGFRRALGRAPEPAEKAVLQALYTKELARFRAAPAEAKALISVGEAPAAAVNPIELAATTTVARAILNLHETITRN